MARQPIVMVACGRRATGKTVETIKTCYQLASGNPTEGIPAKKVLIFDANNEFGDFELTLNGVTQRHKILTLDISQLHIFCHPTYPVQIRRITPFINGQPMSLDEMADTLEKIIKEFKNGCLLVEDINLYINDNVKADIIGGLCTTRHRSCDVVIHYQGIGRIGNPKILSNANVIRMHKTNDSVERHANKFQDKLDILSIAENIVNAKYEYGEANDINTEDGKFFFLYVNLFKNKIYGNFTKEDAELSVRKYMSLNHNRLMKPYINMYDAKGVKMYDKVSAMKAVSEKMLRDFFDF